MKEYRWIALLSLVAGILPAHGASIEVLNALGQVRAGLWEEASTNLRNTDTSDPLGLRLLLEIQLRRGELDRARQTANRLLSFHRTNPALPAADRYHLAYAAWMLQDWETANDLFLSAAENDKAPLSLFVDWGHLYLEKFNPGEAEGIFRDALKTSPVASGERWDLSDAWLGLAESLEAQGKPGSSQAVASALEANPSNPAVYRHRAADLLADEDYDGAAKLVAEGLERFPGELPLLELRTGIAYARGDQGSQQASTNSVLVINPAGGNLFELLGDLAVRRRRLDEAVVFFDRAFELNPGHWSALASKGINLLRLGREEEGIEALERAYQADPYNIWTVNTLRLVDSFAEFHRYETDRFAVRLHSDEAEVLRPYVEELLNRSLTSLEDRYQHKIDFKVSFEMYPDHEDFAVRTLGLPGLGALGATFGRVVAMDSPNARPKGEFHWGATLWHEMAHVVTLSMSQDRIPRWFTEGISMMEERLAGSGWGDPPSPHFIAAYAEGKLLPVRRLNSGFLRPETPEQIAISYLQAGMLCEFLTAKFGLGKIRAMVTAFGEGHELDRVFQQVLASTPEQIDELFLEEAARTLEPLHKALERIETPAPGEEGLRLAVQAHPGNFRFNLALGILLFEQKKHDEAEPYLRKALQLFPHAVDARGPYPYLLQIYEARKDTPAQRDLLEQWWERSPLVAENALKLARLLDTPEDVSRARQVLEQAMYANPFSEELHKELGNRSMQQGDYPRAAREFRVWVALKPAGEAEARFRLADALLASGARSEARREILRSLEIAPGFEEAQELLLRIVRP